MSLDFTGQRVVVTGGMRGIGRALVDAYHAAGATVAMNGSSAASVEAALEAAPDGGIGVAASIADPEACRSLIDASIERMGGVDVLVNNAGISIPGPIKAIEPEQWHRVLDTNLGGASFCTKFALPALKERGGGGASG